MQSSGTRDLSSSGSQGKRLALLEMCAVIKALVKQLQFVPRRLRKVLHRFLIPPLELLPNAPDLFHVYRYLQEHPDLNRRPGGWLYKGKFYPDYLTVGGASPAIFDVAVKYCQGRGIDIGAGLWPLPGSTPVDLERGPGLARTISDFANESLEYVFSSHCLEHIEDWQEALTKWMEKIRPGGILFLYLPHPECTIWHPGSPFVGNGHKWVPYPEAVRRVVNQLGFKVISGDDGPDAMQSFYLCAQKLQE